MKMTLLYITLIVVGIATAYLCFRKAAKHPGMYGISGTVDTRPHHGKDTINIYCHNCDTVSIVATNPADTNLVFNIIPTGGSPMPAQ